MVDYEAQAVLDVLMWFRRFERKSNGDSEVLVRIMAK